MSDGVKVAAKSVAPAQGGNARSHRQGDRMGFENVFKAVANGNKAETARTSHPSPPIADWSVRAKLENAIAGKDGKAETAHAADSQTIRARLQAAIAVKDSKAELKTALSTEDNDSPTDDALACQPQADAEDMTDERDTAETSTNLLALAVAAVQAAPKDNAAKPEPETSGDGKPAANTVAGSAAAEGAVARSPVAEAAVAKSSVRIGTPTEPADPKPAKQAEDKPARTVATDHVVATAQKAAAADAGFVSAATAVQPATAKPAADAKSGDFVAFVPASAETSAVAAAGDAESDSTGFENRRGNSGEAAAKVVVLSDQGAPAPAAAPATTASALVAGLTGDSGWQNSLRSVAVSQHLASQMSSTSLHSMTLQLHPAELGMVTANLRFAGDRLQVELTPENRDAYDRLSKNSDTIVKSLRALGYDIDKVSVQQPQIAHNASGRAETNFSSPGGSARDAQASGSQNQGSGERLGGQGAGRGRENAGGRGEGNAQTSQDRAQRGLYI